MVGDTLKKTGDPSGGRLCDIKEFGDIEYAIYFVVHSYLHKISLLLFLLFLE